MGSPVRCGLITSDERKIIAYLFVVRVAAERRNQRFAGAATITAQEIVVAEVVEDGWRASDDLDENVVGLTSPIEAPQPIVGCGEPEPSFCIVVVLLNRLSERLFRQAKVTVTIVSFADFN